jgi:hypothetical protein
MDMFDSDDVTDEDQSVAPHTERVIDSTISYPQLCHLFVCLSFEDRQVDAYSDAESEG